MTRYKCSILADPKGGAWNLASSIYELLAEKDSKFELNPVHIKRFSDGEIKPQIEKNVRRRNCFFVHNSDKSPADWFLELNLVNSTLKNSSAQEITDVLPYLKFARQDRKDETRVPISARSLADVMELYADRVISLDVHNPSIQGFYKIPMDNLYSFPVVIDYLKTNHADILEDLVIASPDAGGVPRALAFAQRIGAGGLVAGVKIRKEAGKVESLKIMGDVEDKQVLIVDDILSSGGTVIRVAKEMKRKGAKKVYAYCTHALCTDKEKKKELNNYLDKLFVGNTIKLKYGYKKNTEVISFDKLFAEAIYRVNEGKSLSELFD